MTRWVLEDAANPSVIRLHVDVELTAETIVTCPPGQAPAPLDALLLLEGLRTIDLHRYRARLNLEPGAGRANVWDEVEAALAAAWGEAEALPIEELPRAFEIEHGRPRAVAESLSMAGDHSMLAALFSVDGVAEAIVGEGIALVRLGRLFRWDAAEDPVREALATS